MTSPSSTSPSGAPSLTNLAVVAVDMAMRCERLDLDVTQIRIWKTNVEVQLAFLHQANILAAELGFPKAPMEDMPDHDAVRCTSSGVHEGVAVTLIGWMRLGAKAGAA